MTLSVSIQCCLLPSSCLVNPAASHTALYLTTAVLVWVSVSVFGCVKKEVNSRGRKMNVLSDNAGEERKRFSEAYDSLCVLHLNCPHHNNSPLQRLARFLGACLCASPSHSILLHHWCELKVTLTVHRHGTVNILCCMFVHLCSFTSVLTLELTISHVLL